MPRRSPPPLDAERVRALLAAGRSASPVEEPGPRGWLPDGAPPDADTAWADEPVPVVEQVESERPERSGRHRPAPRVLTVPVAFRGAHLSVTWRAVLAAALLLVAAGLVFAVRVARAEQAAVPESVGATGGLVARTSVPPAFASSAGTGPSDGSAGGSVGGSASAVAGTGGGSARASPTSARALVIDVVGQVARPGVVSVPEGSRVSDVLVAAGGVLPSADVQRLNLARLVADGEQVFVPKPGENPPAPVGVVGGGVGGSAGSAAGTGGGSGAASVVPVDINAATLGDLDSLPGVGPVLAQRILDWRAAHGRFSSVDELGEVSGIGDKLLAQIRPKVRV